MPSRSARDVPLEIAERGLLLDAVAYYMAGIVLTHEDVDDAIDYIKARGLAWTVGHHPDTPPITLSQREFDACLQSALGALVGACNTPKTPRQLVQPAN